MSQNISPKIWGPHFWYMMRCIASTYPNNPTIDNMTHAKIFYNELQYLLPCKKCRTSLTQHYEKYPIDEWLVNNTKLSEWVELIYMETTNSISKENNNKNTKKNTKKNKNTKRVIKFDKKESTKKKKCKYCDDRKYKHD